MHLHLIFNHQLTAAQISDAKASLGIKKIKYLPKELQEIWANIPANAALDLEQHLIKLLHYFKAQDANAYVLVQGDFGAVYFMVNYLKDLGYKPIYATTERKIIEEKLTNNTIVTKRIFKHVCFRPYI